MSSKIFDDLDLQQRQLPIAEARQSHSPSPLPHQTPRISMPRPMSHVDPRKYLYSKVAYITVISSTPQNIITPSPNLNYWICRSQT